MPEYKDEAGLSSFNGGIVGLVVWIWGWMLLTAPEGSPFQMDIHLGLQFLIGIGFILVGSFIGHHRGVYKYRKAHKTSNEAILAAYRASTDRVQDLEEMVLQLETENYFLRQSNKKN